MEKTIDYTIAKGEMLKNSVDFLLKDGLEAMEAFKADIETYEKEAKALEGNRDVDSIIAKQALKTAATEAEQLYSEAKANHLEWIAKNKYSVKSEADKVYKEYQESINEQLAEKEKRIIELIAEADELTQFCGYTRNEANDKFNKIAYEINSKLGINVIEAKWENSNISLDRRIKNAIYERMYGTK